MVGILVAELSKGISTIWTSSVVWIWVIILTENALKIGIVSKICAALPVRPADSFKVTVLEYAVGIIDVFVTVAMSGRSINQ